MLRRHVFSMSCPHISEDEDQGCRWLAGRQAGTIPLCKEGFVILSHILST